MMVPSVDMKVTLTVLDTATIIEGPETLYRYDLPGSGVAEGWAVAGVIDQVKASVGPHWPHIDVTIDAQPDIAEKLQEAFNSQGVMTEIVRSETSYEMVHEHEDLEQDPGEPLSEEEYEDTDWSDRPNNSQPQHGKRSWISLGIIACALPVFCGIAWWGFKNAWVDKSGSDTSDAQVMAEEISKPSAEIPEPQPVVLIRGGMEVHLPEGFQIKEEEGFLRATGNDPDLRILLSKDPVHGVPRDAVEQEIRTMIKDNEALTEKDSAQGRIAYQENPGDGSVVEWETWVEGGYQYSVGCHTKTDSTVIQRAACTMARESLRPAGT